MCKKLSIFSLMLAIVVGLSVPASAADITLTNPLMVDIEGNGTISKQGIGLWEPFGPLSWTETGPVSSSFDNGGLPSTWPTVTISANRGPYQNADWGSRDRTGGMGFVGGTYEIAKGTKGLGMNYIRLRFTQLTPDTEFQFNLWGWEKHSVWSTNPNNPDSKYGVWSTTNPQSWLNANGWGEGGIGEPNGGYGPINQPQPPDANTALSDSNMPAGLAALVAAHGDRISLDSGDVDWLLGDWDRGAQFYATTDEDGAINVYGWIDTTDWSGSMHMPCSGFMVIPEPATIALLGLGGLLLRRRKSA